jgi:hypothetical protein
MSCAALPVMMFEFGRPSRVPADQATTAGTDRLGIARGLAEHAGGDARGRGLRVPVVDQVLAERQQVVAIGDI